MEKTVENVELKFLILEIRANNSKSLLKVIDIFDPYLKYISSKMKDKDSYSELLGELFEILIKIDLNKENLLAYIKKCLRNYSYKIDKKFKFNLMLDDRIQNIYGTNKEFIEEEVFNINLDIYEKDKYKILNEVSQNLSLIDKQIFMDYCMYNKSIEYLQIKYNRSKSTIYSRLNKSKKNIEEYVMNNMGV